MKKLVVRGKAYRLNIFDTVSKFRGFTPYHPGSYLHMVIACMSKLLPSLPLSSKLGRSGKVPNAIDELLPRRTRGYPHLRHLKSEKFLESREVG